MFTGYYDKSDRPIFTGDLVKFRCPGFSMSGRGIVYKTDKNTFAIKDNRTDCKRKNVGRIYPMYDDAVYTIIR